MIRSFHRTFILALTLSVLAASPALAQLNAGDPCPEPTPGRIFTQEGAAGPSLVCNGTTLEVDESIKTGPYRRGVGTANPAVMLDVAGEAKIGNTSLACSATTEGAMRYNSTSKEMEYCNGTAWASLSPAGGGGLKVYQADGTTVLGNLVGSYAADCAGLVYADTTTGQVSSLDSNRCPSSASYVYFDSFGCSGSTLIYPGRFGYCCTGSSSCTTSPCIAASTTTSIYYTYSRRSSTGVCSNTAGGTTSGLVGTNPAICGSGQCIVK